jgi:FkbM family methyltransferase
MLNSAARILDYVGPSGLANAVFQSVRGVIARRLLGQRFIQRRIYDYRMWLDLTDPGLSRTMLLFGKRELEHKRLMEMIVVPGTTIFDIGANIGYYAVMESRLLGPSGRVIAIEPSAANVALLRRNLDLNGVQNVTVLEGAVSSVEGEKDIFLSRLSNLNTFHPLEGTETSPERTARVSTTTVRALARKYGPPTLIRMDVEGHEVEILDGMLEAVRAGELAPMIIFEVHRNRYSPEHDFEKTLRALFACGYSVRYAGSSQRSGTKMVEALGYKGGAPIETDFMQRVIFENIRDEDAVTLICKSGGVRTIVLAPPKKQG